MWWQKRNSYKIGHSLDVRGWFNIILIFKIENQNPVRYLSNSLSHQWSRFSITNSTHKVDFLNAVA